MTSSTANANSAFTEFAVVSGLTRGTAYWFDLGFRAVTAGTATMGQIDCFALER
jgi:hypothetical protein